MMLRVSLVVSGFELRSPAYKAHCAVFVTLQCLLHYQRKIFFELLVFYPEPYSLLYRVLGTLICSIIEICVLFLPMEFFLAAI